jgi:hypothetical protein
MRYAKAEGRMYTVSTPTQQEIDAIVATAKAELQPWVQKIFWDYAQDWSGDWALFFRILVSDAVVRSRNSYKTTEQIRRNLIEKVKPQDRGLLAYFSFRGQSEQKMLEQDVWK